MCNCHATRQSMSDIPEIANLANSLGPFALQILKFSAHTYVDGGSAPQSFSAHLRRVGVEQVLSRLSAACVTSTTLVSDAVVTVITSENADSLSSGSFEARELVHRLLQSFTESCKHRFRESRARDPSPPVTGEPWSGTRGIPSSDGFRSRRRNPRCLLDRSDDECRRDSANGPGVLSCLLRDVRRSLSGRCFL